METRKNTTAGVPIWTPAPTRTSPNSSDASDDVWEEEEEEGEEEHEEERDDFFSQMDENGIIGLSEALEDVEVGEPVGGADGRPGSFCPEGTEPSGRMGAPSPEGRSYSRAASPGRELQEPSSRDDMNTYIEGWTEEEEEQEEELIGRNKHKLACDSGELGTTSGLLKDCISEQPRSCNLVPPHVNAPGASEQILSRFAPALSELLRFSAEELARSPGIDAEIFPEMSLSESLPDSQRSLKSFTSRLPCSKAKLGASPQPPAALAETARSSRGREASNSSGKRSEESDKPRKRPVPSPRTTRARPAAAAAPLKTPAPSKAALDFVKSKRQDTNKKVRSPGGRSPPVEVEESRKAAPSHLTPDFSKVEPKVRFPKDGYKPPKSRPSAGRESLFPDAPLVFKSPADIVKEVLLNAAEEPPPSSGRAAISTLPEDFRSRRQATTLLEQLQEDYDRLLTKYAAAENTIDRLRLEAKVNLYSEPPPAGHCAQSAVNHQAMNFIKLDFPQAHRVEIDAASPGRHGNHRGSSASCQSARSPVPHLGQQLASVLFSQADKFLQQLQSFDNLLKSGKLEPFQQAEGLAQLCEGLDSLERGYLLTRDRHKLLQHPGAEISQFDPDRELEGLIFQCGLYTDELKEQVGQVLQREPVCEAPPSPPPQPMRTSTPAERGKASSEAQIFYQSPLVSSPDGPGEASRMAMSSDGRESDGEETLEEEATLDSLYLKPPPGKHRCTIEDFPMPSDQEQIFKELPKVPAHGLREQVPITASLSSSFQPGDEEERRQSQETGNRDDQKTPTQRRVKCEQQDSSTSGSKHLSSSPPLCGASRQPVPSAGPRPSRGRSLEKGKSHSSSLSSLGDPTASQRRSSKGQSGCRRLLSQDGVISPETDSGFVGSESSRQTLGAAPSPVRQREPESAPVSQVEMLERPHAGPIAAPPPSSSSSHGRAAPQPSAPPHFSLPQPRRSRQGPRRRTFSCSPRGRAERTAASRELGIQSDSSEQSDRYTQSFDSLHSSQLSSSSSSLPGGRYHHGDLALLGPSQEPNCNEALQVLQAEVTRLKERLESGLMRRMPVSSVKAAPSAQQRSSRHSRPASRVSSADQHSYISEARREAMAADESDESTLKATARKRSSSALAHKPPHDDLKRSELGPSTLQPPQPQMSRYTQTSAAPGSCCLHTSVTSSATLRRPPLVVPGDTSEAADEADSRRSERAPSSHRSRHGGRAERPGGGDKEPIIPSAHCLLCEHHKNHCCTGQGRRRLSDSASRRSSESPGGAARSRHVTDAATSAAAPPAMLHCLPVSPPQLLLYTPPLYVTPQSSSAGTLSKVRGRVKAASVTGRSPSVDEDGPTAKDSLSKAIRAARRMKHTSRHMAHSLAAGLQHQKLLTQS